MWSSWYNLTKKVLLLQPGGRSWTAYFLSSKTEKDRTPCRSLFTVPVFKHSGVCLKQCLHLPFTWRLLHHFQIILLSTWPCLWGRVKNHACVGVHEGAASQSAGEMWGCSSCPPAQKRRAGYVEAKWRRLPRLLFALVDEEGYVWATLSRPSRQIKSLDAHVLPELGERCCDDAVEWNYLANLRRTGSVRTGEGCRCYIFQDLYVFNAA